MSTIDGVRCPGRRAVAPLRWAGDRGAILAAAVLWGTTGTVATFAPRGTSSLAIGAAAMGFGGILLLVAGGRRVLIVVADRSARVSLVTGAACVVIYPLAFYTSMATAGVAVGVTVTIGASPIAAALIERYVDGRRLSPRWAAATAAAVAGAVLLGVSGAYVGRPRTVMIGIALALVAGACYGGYSVVAARLIGAGMDSRAALGAVFGLAAAVLLPVLAVADPTLLSTRRGVVVTGYLAIVPMFLGYVLFGRGLRQTPASTATAISLVEPVVAAVLALVVVHQRVALVGWVGIALIVVSVAVLARSTRAPRDLARVGPTN